MERVLHDNLPAAYEFSVEGVNLVVRVRIELLRHLLAAYQRDASMLSRHATWERLPAFIAPDQERWGYDGVFVSRRAHAGWIEWGAELTDKKGERIAYTLEWLLDALERHTEELSLDQHQLVMVRLHRLKKRGFGFRISASLAPQVIKWMSEQPHRLGFGFRFGVVEDAMRSTFHRLSGDERAWQATFTAPRQFELSCPEDLCRLSGEGELLDERILNPYQQLTLVVGLARLHDLLRAAGL